MDNLICNKSHSTAHQRSEFAIIDPFYSPDQEMPPPDIRSNAAPWPIRRFQKNRISESIFTKKKLCAFVPWWFMKYSG